MVDLKLKELVRLLELLLLVFYEILELRGEGLELCWFILYLVKIYNGKIIF